MIKYPQKGLGGTPECDSNLKKLHPSVHPCFCHCLNALHDEMMLFQGAVGRASEFKFKRPHTNSLDNEVAVHGAVDRKDEAEGGEAPDHDTRHAAQVAIQKPWRPLQEGGTRTGARGEGGKGMRGLSGSGVHADQGCESWAYAVRDSLSGRGRDGASPSRTTITALLLPAPQHPGAPVAISGSPAALSRCAASPPPLPPPAPLTCTMPPMNSGQMMRRMHLQKKEMDETVKH